MHFRLKDQRRQRHGRVCVWGITGRAENKDYRGGDVPERDPWGVVKLEISFKFYLSF